MQSLQAVSRRLRSLAVFLTFLSCFEGLRADEVHKPVFVTVRYLPSVSMARLEYLAAVTEPDIETTDGKETLRDILRRHYGSSVKKIRSLFARYNPGLPANLVPAGKRLVFPAAPYWTFNVRKRVNRGLDEIVEAEMGYAGPVTLRQVRAMNPAPHPGHSWVVKLPYTTKARTFRLKRALEPSVAAVRRNLYGKWSKDDVAHDVGGRLTLISDFNDEPDRNSCFAYDPASWLGREFSPSTAPYAGGPRSSSVRVAILDSGLPDPNDARFKLWRNSLSIDGPPIEDLDEARYADAVIGYDFAEHRPMPIDNLRTQQRGHGEHVAGIASGRLSVSTAMKELDERIVLMILKIVDANGTVIPDAVTNAIKFADDHSVDIANLSLEGLSYTVRDAVADRHRVLFVVAAGNGDKSGAPINLDHVNVFPPELARDHENIISVAASGPNGLLACFSNRGEKTVTLAAPGIAIDSTYDQGERRISGTSQATPLVTMVAAMIMSKGMREPRLVKSRIMASVDFDRRLERDVVTSGRLNIQKALSLFDDLIQLRCGDIVVGSIDPATHVELLDRDLPLRSISKIVRYSDDVGHRHRVIQIAHGKQTFIEGDIITPSLTIVTTAPDGSTQRRVISIDDIADVVPASLTRPATLLPTPQSTTSCLNP